MRRWLKLLTADVTVDKEITMRRKDFEKDRAFAYQVIDRCAYGVIAMVGENENTNGGPYCTPVSFARVEDRLYFHGAVEGTKVSFLKHDPRVCVSFVAFNQAATDKFTTYYQSANVMGIASEITDDTEKALALHALCKKLTPANMIEDRFEQAFSRSCSRVRVWCIQMKTVTGKEKPFP